MKILIIGHRGSGKTSFLKRHEKYFPKIKHFDLDAEIEKQQALTVAQIFAEKGEEIFRKIEASILKSLMNENENYVISLGAGFPLSQLPVESDQKYKTIFISRLTDKDGRIFLNRPDFKNDNQPLSQYLERFEQRQKNYLKYSDFIYDMPEGEGSGFDLFEKKIFSESFHISDAVYTLTEKDVSNIKFWMQIFDQIELRTDLLSSEQILYIVEQNPYHHWLVAFRTGYDLTLLEKLNSENNIWLDWEVHLPHHELLYTKTKKIILSSHANCSHEGIEQLEDFQQKYGLKNAGLKLSPKIESIKQLQKIYEWQQRDSSKRSVLPRSDDGKWVWFRQWAKYNQPLNFVKSGLRLNDQPSFYQWLILPKEKPSYWAAVIGNPIRHSRSPLEHEDFFISKHSFMSAIVASNELSHEDLSFLKYLGLKCLAVTSPLKQLFFKWSTEKSEVTKHLQSVNTVYINDKKMYAENTDLKGFQSLIDLVKLKINNFSEKDILVWGGGGTLDMIRQVLPQAKFYSASKALPRSEADVTCSPSILVWAAPRGSEVKWPTDIFSKEKFEAVIDLNYQENSMGLEFAKINSIRYFSGLEMFKAQAFEQRIFWQKHIVDRD